MNVVIRTDASIAIGTGHVMRCLTLADELRRNDHKVTFVCRELPGNLCGYIRQAGYELISLAWEKSQTKGIDPDDLYANWLSVPHELEMDETETILKNIVDIDWLVVDHYALDYNWEQRMRPQVVQIIAVDDLANRRHNCDLLLDQNLFPEADTRYLSLIPPETKMMLGPQYALLRKEFQISRETISNRSGEISQLLVFYGGSDPSNQTCKGLDAIAKLGDKISECDVIVGGSNQNAAQIKNLCDKNNNLTFHQSVNNMAHLMAKADLAFGSPGSSTWERCCLGLPSLVTAIAENQIPIGQSTNLHQFGKYLGVCEEVTSDMIASELVHLMDNPQEVSKMSQRGMELVDGFGAKRVCQAMKSHSRVGVTI